MCICTHRLCTCGHLSDQSAKFSEYTQELSTCLPNSKLPCCFYFLLFLPTSSKRVLKPLFHLRLHMVFLSKHFLFNSHFVIQTILGIIALKSCVWQSKSHCSSHTFSCYPSNWRLWKVICCHIKKTDLENLQLQDQAFKTRIQG